MTAPDEQVRCRCGRSTFLVPGSDTLRTCSKCGYLTSYCRCKRLGPLSTLGDLRLPNVTDRTRVIVGSAVVSSIGTLFAVALFYSPFFALFGLGLPFGLNVSFFAKWLKDQRPAVSDGGMLAAPKVTQPDLRRV